MGEYHFGSESKIEFSQNTDSWVYKIDGWFSVESSVFVLHFRMEYVYSRNFDSGPFEICLSKDQISGFKITEKKKKAVLELCVDDPQLCIIWPDSDSKKICIKLPIERMNKAANMLLDFVNGKNAKKDSEAPATNDNFESYYFKMYDDKANKISGFLSVSQTSLKVSYHVQSSALEAIKYQAENWEINLDQITYIGIRKKILHYVFSLRFEGMEVKRFPYIVDGCLVLKIPKVKGVNVEQRIMELVNKKYDRIIDQR